MKKRQAVIERKTKETKITCRLTLDGEGKGKIDSGIGFLDHMLELFAFWGFFDLELAARGDLKVDIHHTNEDIGIALGQAFKKALGSKEKIRRFGYACVPMEDVLASVVLDVSGRGAFSLNTKKGDLQKHSGHISEKHALSAGQDYGLADASHFFESLAKNLGMNLNITIDPLNQDLHTSLEPVFKALGLAMDQATQIEPRRKGIPSTKGVID